MCVAHSHEIVAQRLRADASDVDFPMAQRLDAVVAGPLSVAGRDAGRGDLDVTAILCGVAQEPLRHRAAADVAGADEKDAFWIGHGEEWEIYRDDCGAATPNVHFARSVACANGSRGNNDGMMRHLIRLLPCLLVVFVTGCSTYGKRFAEASKIPAKPGHFAGAYSGRWMSAKSPGSGGNLRCILSPVNASDYRADFHATWHGFASEHSVVIHTKPSARGKAGSRDFEGTSKVRTPIGAGTYTCRGTLSFREMLAGYDATYDRGTFELVRIAPGSAGR